MIYNWCVVYRIGNTYKSKNVFGKTAEHAIKNARVKNVCYLYKEYSTAIPDTNSTLYVRFDGNFTNEEMNTITNDISKEISHQQLFFNDLECRHWSFDYKTKSGEWVQNISYSDSLEKVYCLVQKGV